MKITTSSAPPAALTPFEAAVDRLEVVASPPAVVQRLLVALADPDTSWRAVEEAMAIDPGIVARVLRMASAAAFAGRPVRDLRTALQMLGNDQLRRIAVAAQFAGHGSAFEGGLWAYSLRIAFTADALARVRRVTGAPDAFLCGLLHDVGTMVLGRLVGPTYARLGFGPGDDQQAAIERDRFGFDHADLGAMVAARWSLFPELELINQLHHDPDLCDVVAVPAATRIAIEWVALARALGREPDDPQRVARDALCTRLDLDPDLAEACGFAATQQASEVTATLR